MRCFVGIMVPEHVKSSAAALQDRIVGSGIKCKPVEWENMHICLSFLGDVAETESLGRELDAVAGRHGRFEVEIGKIKFVPSENYIRVIVLEATSADDSLEKLRKDVAETVGGDSKPPHLTLCRVKNVEDKRLLVEKFGSVACNERFAVDRIQLIKSELGRSGPVYTVMHESMLS